MFRHWLSVAVALLLLNGAVTFHNVWPTLGIHWPGELSIDLVVLLIGLAASNARFGPTPPRVLAALAVVVVLFALGRYGEVTAPALYGREVNLYWDLPHVGLLIGMFARVAPTGIVVAALLGTICGLVVLYAAARWSLGRVDAALRMPQTRRAFSVVAVLLFIVFIVQRTIDHVPRIPQFSIPVSHTYALQLKRIYDTFSFSHAARNLPPSPHFQSDLKALAGADLIVVFMESYGRVTYDRPEMARRLAPARQRLQEAASASGRGVASAFVTSPTFGGLSWFAHSSFMAGVPVTDPNRYALLLTQQRPTLVSFFERRGYRAIANMPGLHKSWPEGSFYGFDRIYDARALDYPGPEFGWWRIPDQFSLAALDAHEIRRQPRPPLLVFFPTINTHIPFRPTPPFQQDWNRVLTSAPFDAVDVQRSITQAPDWTNLGEGYVASLIYSFDMLASYLRLRADEGFVMVLLGDHQPAASVTGKGAPWDVPVHVISRNPEILEALQRHGFVAGLEPGENPIAPMHHLGQILLDAFDSHSAASGIASGTAKR